MEVRSMQSKIEFGSLSLIKCLGPTLSSSHLSCWFMEAEGHSQELVLCPFWFCLPSLFSAGLSELKWQIKCCDWRWLNTLFILSLGDLGTGHCSVWLGHSEISSWNSCLCASVPKVEVLLVGKCLWAVKCAEFLWLLFRRIFLKEKLLSASLGGVRLRAGAFLQLPRWWAGWEFVLFHTFLSSLIIPLSRIFPLLYSIPKI